LFYLDTGGRCTAMYEPYWRENPDACIGLKPGSLTFWGVGGRREVPAFNDVEVPLAFGKASVVFHRMTVLTEPHNTDTREHFYGNLGEDLLHPLRSWTLDYRAMRFQLDRGPGH